MTISSPTMKNKDLSMKACPSQPLQGKPGMIWSGKLILFENQIQTTSALSATSKQCFELTSSVLSTTSKQCFEQPAASFLVCSLIFIKYKK